MLTQLLRALADPDPRPLADIAAALGMSPGRLAMALEHCERLGYLDRGEIDCSVSACGSCPVACGLLPADRGAQAVAPRWWRLTERGRRAAAMARPA